MKRILLTGATGYLGMSFEKNCRDLGIETKNITRSQSDEEIKNLMLSFQPEAVVHFAALFVGEHKSHQIEDLVRSNVEFGVRILEAMRITDVKNLVTAGSAWQDYEFEGRPSNLYAATKNAFELIAKYYSEAYHFNVISMRIYDSAGPNDPRPKLLPILAKKSSTNEVIQMNSGRQFLHVVHTADIIRAFFQATERTLSSTGSVFEVFYIRSLKQISLKALVEAFLSKTGGKPKVEWGVRPDRFREVMVPYEGGTTLPGWRPEHSLDNILDDVLRSSEAED